MKNLLILVFLVFSVGCSNTYDPVIINESVNEEPFNLDQVVESLRGSNFIEKYHYKNDSVFVKYYNDFESYKKGNPNSKLDSTAYHIYWSSIKVISKTLSTSVLDLGRKVPRVAHVSVIVPFEGWQHQISIGGSDLARLMDLYTDDELVYGLKTDQWLPYIVE